MVNLQKLNVMEVMEKIPVKFTESAISEVKRLMNEAGLDNAKKLRVGVKGGGCSGMTYVLEFDQVQDADQHFLINDIPVIIAKSAEMYLLDMVVNWEGGLNSRGFTFQNPNASSTCGCGTSFAV